MPTISPAMYRRISTTIDDIEKAVPPQAFQISKYIDDLRFQIAMIGGSAAPPIRKIFIVNCHKRFSLHNAKPDHTFYVETWDDLAEICDLKVTSLRAMFSKCNNDFFRVIGNWDCKIKRIHDFELSSISYSDGIPPRASSRDQIISAL